MHQAQCSRLNARGTRHNAWIAAFVLGIVGFITLGYTQTHGVAEEFNAIAIANDNLRSGAGRVIIRVERWSTDGERERLVRTLLEEGPRQALEALRDTEPVGFIRAPDSIGYDLHYAHQMPGEDGGRRIVVATDRPIGAWEAWYRPRTIEYPFTVIQMQIGGDGKGSGTMSYATKVIAHDNIVELENYATSPVMLTEIQARPVH
ncbi:MAG: hypothetical protein AB7K63_03955 [Vicinamibacterales bacterium]